MAAMGHSVAMAAVCPSIAGGDLTHDRAMMTPRLGHPGVAVAVMPPPAAIVAAMPPFVAIMVAVMVAPDDHAVVAGGKGHARRRRRQRGDRHGNCENKRSKNGLHFGLRRLPRGKTHSGANPFHTGSGRTVKIDASCCSPLTRQALASAGCVA